MSSPQSSSRKIRIATADDIPALVTLINEAFLVETFLDGPRTNTSKLAEMMCRGKFLIAESVGEGGVQLDASVYVEKRGERGYFGMLAVNGSRRGTGLGRLMVDAAEKHVYKQGCTHMDITVLSLRTELPPFYRKLGYEETGTKPFDASPQKLTDGLECWCVVMSKEL